ncbi:MAG: ketoacyl-synthetase C-terminal extension domain-containing protein, partial [Pirellulaceae bacterium]
SQQAVIRKAQQDAGILPEEVSYVEAHGTGTPLGDPIEFNSLKKVLQNGQPHHETCWIGSVKTNIGHLEAAAGIAGLIKTVLALGHEEIPPHLHLNQLNPNITLNDSRLSIPTQRMAWPRGKRSRLAGVNSFGFGGTNVHVVLGEAPALPPRDVVVDRPAHLLALSARDPQALDDLLDRYDRHLAANTDLSLADVCFTANAGRSHFPHRLAIVAESNKDCQEKLRALKAGEQPGGTYKSTSAVSRAPKLALLFSGDRSLLGRIDSSLLLDEPASRDALCECDDVLQDAVGWSFEKFLFRDAGHPVPFDDAAHMQPAVLALEYAMAKLWAAWGISPNVLMGCGFGELTAACLAGVFDLESAIRLAVARSRMLQEASQQQIEAYEALCHAIPYTEPELRIVSGMPGDPKNATMATAQYWCEQPKRSCETKAWIDAIREEGYRVFVEIGSGFSGHESHSSTGEHCQAMSAREAERNGELWLSCPGRETCDWRDVLALLAKLYTRGVPVDWQAFDRRFHRCKTPLPGYPFQRKRYWLDMGDGESDEPRSPQPDASALGSLLGSPSLLAAEALQEHDSSLESPTRRAPGPGQVEIHVRAWDSEGGCAGEIARVGDEVGELQVGDAVVAVASNGTPCHVTIQ